MERAGSYGGGFGRVLAKHSLPFHFFCLVVFDFARAVLHLMLGDRGRAEKMRVAALDLLAGLPEDAPVAHMDGVTAADLAAALAPAGGGPP